MDNPPRPNKSVKADPIQPEEPAVNAFARNSNIFTAESSRDPIAKLAEILAMPQLTQQDKVFLIAEHKARFKNRRKMAYISLTCLLALFLVILIGILSDGFYICEGDDEYCRFGILKVMNANSDVIVWISGFFTSIVAAYFGSTIIRPSS